MDLENILRRAVELGASDVHLKLDRPPIVRHDGTLSELDGDADLTETDLELALDRICAETPKRLQAFLETGELDSAYSPPGLPRFRVNGFRQRGSISIAFRVIPRDVPDFEQLSLPAGVGRLAEEHRGLVLVTGATGSGKTTTLAAMIDHINRSRRQHIVTIEDPIEIIHTDHQCIVNQREVGLDTASFAQALRRGLRQDPDVILIGELRDAETAETALQAAESGHLVLSTMHTVDASETIGRMVEFFPAIKQPQIRSIMAGVLRGVISQRLLPRLGGGRVPAVEVMIGNARIADLIRDNKTDEITDAIGEGAFFQMQTFTDALLELVLAGRIDREVAANAASNRHDFLIALERALKEQALAAPPSRSRSPNRRPRAAVGARAGAAGARPRRTASRPARPRRRSTSRMRSRRCGLPDARSREASCRLRRRGADARTRRHGGRGQLRRRPLDRELRADEAPPPARRRHDRRHGRVGSRCRSRPRRELWGAAGSTYGIPWQVLAAINKVESNFGRNLGPSSAGAVGWMQFMPSTWLRWGVDANGDGVADPANPADAIFSAARYLAAAGGQTDLRRAVFAYNHADWYVNEVLGLASLYGQGGAEALFALDRLQVEVEASRGQVADLNDRLVAARGRARTLARAEQRLIAESGRRSARLRSARRPESARSWWGSAAWPPTAASASSSAARRGPRPARSHARPGQRRVVRERGRAAPVGADLLGELRLPGRGRPRPGQRLRRSPRLPRRRHRRTRGIAGLRARRRARGPRLGGAGGQLRHRRDARDRRRPDVDVLPPLVPRSRRPRREPAHGRDRGGARRADRSRHRAAPAPAARPGRRVSAGRAVVPRLRRHGVPLGQRHAHPRARLRVGAVAPALRAARPAEQLLSSGTGEIQFSQDTLYFTR